MTRDALASLTRLGWSLAGLVASVLLLRIIWDPKTTRWELLLVALALGIMLMTLYGRR
jgi:hypothetical protein